MSLKKKAHFKQIALFLVAVILPSLVLVFFTLRMIRQEDELLEKRRLEERSFQIAGVAGQLMSRLERIKVEEVSVRTDRSNLKNYQNAEVVLVTSTSGQILHLPWEAASGATGSPLLEERYVERIGNGEFQEFANRNLRGAARVYETVATSVRNPAQSAYAWLLYARTLAKLGRAENALEEYSRIASVPPSVVDEYGIPLASYACQELLQAGRGRQQAIELVSRALETDSWLRPEVAYNLRGLVRKAGGEAAEVQLRESARTLVEKLNSQIEDLEQVLRLQTAYPVMELRRNMAGDKAPLWALFGENHPWLVSVASHPRNEMKFLIAIRFESLQRSFFDEHVSDPGFTLSPDSGKEGEALGPSFPGLGIIFDVQESTVERGFGRQYTYTLILFLVLGVTSFGAYLLWRDVQRDIRLSEIRTQFVSSVSHELKTPLTAIRIFAETLRLGRSRNAEKQKEYLDTIVNESERLTRLINNVLDFSKIEKGKRSYLFEPTSLPDIIEACAATLRYPLSQQGFHLRVQIQDDLPEVAVDGDAIEQAVLNLLNNAIKYSGDSREIELNLFRQGPHAVIQVRDFGIGIDPPEHRRIFQRFYRVASPAASGTVGTGIGLALASHIVQSHGGRIDVESSLGQGSTFSIFLKLESKL